MKMFKRAMMTLIAALGIGQVAVAGGGPAKPPVQYRCIWLPSVESTKVIDDQTILFRLSGKRILKVTLTYPCTSLKFYDFFSYTTRTDQLCAKLDMIVSRNGDRCPIDSIVLYHPTSPSPPRRDGSPRDRK